MLRFNCKLKQIYVWVGNGLRKHTGYVGQILLGVLLCIHIWMGCIGPKGRIYTYRCILLPFVCYPNRFDCYYYYYYQFVICLLSNQIWFCLDSRISLSLALGILNICCSPKLSLLSLLSLLSNQIWFSLDRGISFSLSGTWDIFCYLFVIIIIIDLLFVCYPTRFDFL